MKVIAFAVCVLGLSLALSACSAAEDAVGSPTAAPSDKILTPRSFGSMSEGEAIEAGTAKAAHRIGDSPVQEATAELTTWAGVRARLADRGVDVERRSPGNPGEPLEDTAVWLVILKGLFYEPQGPPTLTPRPEPEPLCAEWVVLMIDPASRLRDNTDLASKLTFLPAEGCD